MDLRRDELEVSPGRVKAMLQSEAPALLLIDCREESEWRIARIVGARLIPLAEIAARLDDIADELAEEERPVVVHCHHGVRSLKAAMLLRQRGIQAWSMAGGIDRWSTEVDGSVARY